MTAIVPARSATSSSALDEELLLELVVRNVTDAVIIAETGATPGDLRIVYVNPAFTQMTGYAASDVRDASPRLLQGPATCRLARMKMRDALASLAPIEVEVTNYRKDGSEYRVAIRLAPIVNAAGACTHWIAVQREVPQPGPADETGARERAAAEFAYHAEHDDLTGLYHRGAFMRRLEAAIARAKDDPACTFALLYLDLERFKLVNDSLGHRMGDRILRDLARRFESLAGPGDVLARVGGDEFALLLDGPSADHVLQLAGNLLFETSKRARFRSDDVVISASIGIVHGSPAFNDAELLVRDAEIALAHARERGGGTYAVFTPEMHAAADTASRLRGDLYGAVERNELRLLYQPLVDIATGAVYGFEGLVRWQHPVHGLLVPDDFIPVAEETGVIVELGRWVLREGCRQACAFQAVAGRPLTISLNVSSQQLLHPRFMDHLGEAIAGSSIDPRTLQLEITESVFLAGGAVVGSLFAQIRALGVQIAFDDFGTGYSSLSYLERFQIDTLKIDKSFVGRIHDASAKSEILRMIIALAHALGVDIVAEGVESRAQRDALGHLGCTHLQGFLFSRPITEAAANSLLLASAQRDRTPLDALLKETLTSGGAGLSDAQRRELAEQVDAAIQTHYVWIDRLHAAVATGESPFDLAEVAREDLCPIGIWLNTTISPELRTMPLYYVTKSRHAVFHRSAARLLAAAADRQPEAALSLRPDGDLSMVAASLLRTLLDWRVLASAPAEPDAEDG